MQTPTMDVTPRPGIRNVLRPPGHPMGGIFCNPEEAGISILDDVRLGEAMVRPLNQRMAPFSNISTYNPDGMLSPMFGKKYFKQTDGLRTGSAITRQESAGNQFNYIGDLCVKIPAHKYREIGPMGPGPLIRDTSPDSCVAIITRVTTIFIQVTFTSLADYDIILTEPDGTTVDPVNNSSPSGGKHGQSRNDFSPLPCISPRPQPYVIKRREKVEYPVGSMPQSGKYKIKMIKRDNCDMGPISFELNVLYKDNKVSKKRRVSMAGAVANSTVAKFRFTIPADV